MSLNIGEKCDYFLIPQDQYVLCHTVVADFLNDFDAYANFKDLI